MSLITRFHEAFARRDPQAMGACYHPAARFSDPVFPDLDAAGVRAMWAMLLTSGTDLRTAFTVLDETDAEGHCRWEAWYTFSRTGRPVHNVISSAFRFQDGLIVRQVDTFPFWRWSRQALGTSGLLLGWTPLVRTRVQRTAAAALRRALEGS
ncbi:MAG: nuclear transport factor 2 family protein [Bacteroidetes bacterium]|nr:nuclear transport factor 2 family protein [Bacteroidota bacterium]